jgi:hypothetical protein
MKIYWFPSPLPPVAGDRRTPRPPFYVGDGGDEFSQFGLTYDPQVRLAFVLVRCDSLVCGRRIIRAKS